MNKLERLLDLVAALLDTDRPLSRHDLRRRMPRDAYSDNDESFRRTFERDKDELRILGLPLVVEPVPGTDPPLEGYTIHQSDYGAGNPDLDPDELASLHLASNLVRLGGMPLSESLLKLGGTQEVSERHALADVPGGEQLGALIEAATEYRVVSFDYGDDERTVEPNRLVFHRGHWYVLGYDQGRAAPRRFRLDRIHGSVTVLADLFEPRESILEITDEPPWQYGEDVLTVARLLVEARHAPWVVDYVGKEAVIERRADGSLVVELEVRNRTAFRSFVLTFLDGAEILDPPEIREDLRAWLEALV